MDIECPTCKTEFQGLEWHPGECPGCGKKYDWDEYGPEDYSDSFIEIVWE